MERGPRRLVLIGLLLAHACSPAPMPCGTRWARRPTRQTIGPTSSTSPTSAPCRPARTSRRASIRRSTTAQPPRSPRWPAPSWACSCSQTPASTFSPAPTGRPTSSCTRQAKTGRGAVTCLPFAWRLWSVLLTAPSPPPMAWRAPLCPPAPVSPFSPQASWPSSPNSPSSAAASTTTTPRPYWARSRSGARSPSCAGTAAGHTAGGRPSPWAWACSPRSALSRCGLRRLPRRPARCGSGPP